MNFHVLVLLCVFLGTMLAAADDDANEPKGIDAYAVGEGSGDDLLEDEGNKDRNSLLYFTTFFAHFSILLLLKLVCC